MDEKKEKWMKNKGALKAALHLATVAVIAVVIIFIFVSVRGDREPEITSTFITNKLEEASELTSAKMIYNGLVRYSDGEIPFLTQKAFTMIYRAEVRAGIDLKKVEPSVTKKKVTIKVPKAEIQDIHVDADSIQYYDEKFALFNGEKREDAIEAIKSAQEDVRENGDVEELKNTAQEQVKILLEGLFQDSIGDRKLEIINN